MHLPTSGVIIAIVWSRVDVRRHLYSSARLFALITSIRDALPRISGRFISALSAGDLLPCPCRIKCGDYIIRLIRLQLHYLLIRRDLILMAVFYLSLGLLRCIHGIYKSEPSATHITFSGLGLETLNGQLAHVEIDRGFSPFPLHRKSCLNDDRSLWLLYGLVVYNSK